MEDTLKERLRKMWRDNDGNPEKAMQAAYNLALSERWVDVKEYVPLTQRDNDCVLISHDIDKWVVRGVLFEGEWYNDFDPTCPCYPTHWQPLPTPPQTKD